MSRRGSCYDNAPPGTTHAESIWSRFKDDLLTLEISHHIAYYNAEHRHSALGYHSPNHFETHLQTTSQLCPA